MGDFMGIYMGIYMGISMIDMMIMIIDFFIKNGYIYIYERWFSVDDRFLKNVTDFNGVDIELIWL